MNQLRHESLPVNDPAVKPLSADFLPSARHLRVFYFLFLGALGTHASYLSLALLERGHSLAQVSILYALSRTMLLVAPLFWSLWADRFQITDILLKVLCWSSFIAFLPVVSGGYFQTGICLMLFALFRAPASALVDSLALKRSERSGEGYGTLRMWGTIGYVVMTLAGGYAAQAFGAVKTVQGSGVFLLGAALVSLTLPSPEKRLAQPILPALKALVTHGQFVVFILSVVLHTIGQSCYDIFFPVHLDRLGLNRSYIGWAVAVGGITEVLVMWKVHRLLNRFGVERILMVAASLACLRWMLNSVVTHPALLVLIQIAHGITFGAWWIAASTQVDRLSPPHIRASAQALLSMMSYGIGGIVAMGLGGLVGDHYGTSVLFQICGVFSALSILVLRKGRK